jgi:hypothetical protein
MSMAKKYNGVVDSVRVDTEGRVTLVRLYERRGPTWSDRILLDREKFIERLKDGQTYMIGSRTPFMAGTFKVTNPVKLVNRDGKDFLANGDADGLHEELKSVPRF